MPRYVEDETCIICVTAIKAVERFRVERGRAKKPFGLAIHYLGECCDEPLLEFYADEDRRDAMFAKLGEALKQESKQQEELQAAHLEAVRREGKEW